MAEYRYHFYDLQGTYLDTLPVENTSFSAELRGVGSFSGDVPLYADGLTADRVMAATVPDRTKVFVERGETLVWGGRIVPPRDYESSTGRIGVTAEETLGAFAHRYLPTLEFLQTDQFDIFRGIVDSLQGDTGGDLGITVDDDLSGVLRDRHYTSTDQTVGLTALTNLSEVINGFEFATQVVWDAFHRPVEKLVLAYPRMGRAGTDSGLVLEYDRFTGEGGSVDGYSWSDGPGLFTRSWATTQTEEGVQLVASATNTELLSQGYPMLEQTHAYDGITRLGTLQGHADALSAYAAGHRVTATFTVKAQQGLEIGDWQMGDEALVRISDWRFPPDPGNGVPGFTDYLRIVGWEVAPGPEGAETYTFTMGDFLETL